ncbi:MAG: hypothetical protein ACI9MC_002296 [Kiritimatiellia bacterium]|jgi:hypothetical protein
MRSLLFAMMACGPSAAAPPVQSAPPVSEVQSWETPAPVAPAHCDGLDTDDAWLTDFFSRNQQLLEPPYHDWITAPAVDPERYRLQVVVGEVRGTGVDRCIAWHPFRVKAEYLYPASAIKPLVAITALQTMRRQVAANPALVGLDFDTPIRVEALLHGKAAVADARTTTLRNEVNLALIKSNNPAFNFLYDLSGQEGMHRQLWDAGLASVHLNHRLARWGLSGEAQRKAPRMVAKLDGAEVELVPVRRGKIVLPGHGWNKPGVGSAHKNYRTQQLVNEPMDFGGKNAVSVYDLARMTAWIADPKLEPKLLLPDVTDADRTLVADAMRLTPFDWAIYHPIRAGVMEAVPGNDVSYLAKGGQAYGFHSEVAYVQRRSNSMSFVVGVMMYANPNDVLNDGHYGYDAVSAPFMTALGAALGQELLVEQP